VCVVDWGLVARIVTAIGAIGAALAALWIATRDRKDRKKEREDAALAQARLVVLAVSDWEASPFYRVSVQNHGLQPLLDVRLESAELSSDPTATWDARGQQAAYTPILGADGDQHRFAFTFVDESSNSIYANFEPLPLSQVKDVSDVSATIQFRDASHNRWRLTSSGVLTRL
jgi:hypothetical protein